MMCRVMETGMAVKGTDVFDIYTNWPAGPVKSEEGAC